MYSKEAVYALLGDKGIVYECMEHPPVYTMKDTEAAGITKKGAICKNLFLRDAKGTNHYLVTLPSAKRVNLKGLAEQLGSSKLSFASAERLQKYLGVAQGCVSPLGVLNDESRSVVVVFDQDLPDGGAVGVHPNDNTASIWLAFADLRKIIEQHGNPIAFAAFDAT